MASAVSGAAVRAIDKAMVKTDMASTETQKAAATISTTAKEDISAPKMNAVCYVTTKSVDVCEHSRPAITDEGDAIVRMTTSALCGTDLHLYLGYVPGMKSGQVIGHEAMGIIQDVGPKVKNFKKGDRVIVSCMISCGECHFCKEGEFSMCDRTNPSTVQETMTGARAAAILGFTEMQAGLCGGQADYVRVPIADVNLLPIQDQNLPDEKVIFLSDILPTAWFGNELAGVGQGDVVAIWGAGPVGLLAAHCAFARGARRVIIVDNIPYRLEFAKKHIPKIETVDFSKDSMSTAGERQVLDMCKDEPAHAPDCCIECVGMHYAHSFVHRAEMAVGLETDTSESLNAAMYACKKGGRIGAIGAYVGYANHFNVGALMQKNLTLRSGQVPLHRYWKQLLVMIQEGKIDPSFIVTHTMPLEDAPKAYQMFNEKLDNVVKVLFKPSKNSGK